MCSNLSRYNVVDWASLKYSHYANKFCYCDKLPGQPLTFRRGLLYLAVLKIHSITYWTCYFGLMSSQAKYFQWRAFFVVERKLKEKPEGSGPSISFLGTFSVT